MDYSAIQWEDAKLFEILKKEEKRQIEWIELIPSENYTSPAVMQAMGSIFTNKYSEGYARKRYYWGQINIDLMEELAIKRAKKLFRCEHVNIQPYSGSPANMAVYFGLLEHRDKVMGMELAHGGHITHWLPISFSWKNYEIISYGVDKQTWLIDMKEVEDKALKFKPKMIIAWFSAYPRNLDWAKFREIANEIWAILMADIAHISGLIAAGILENPFDYWFDIVTTTTHKTLRWPRGGMVMCKEKYAKAIDRAVFPGLQGWPHDHVNAAKAICFKEALSPEFKSYSLQVLKNAKVLGETLREEGFDLCTEGTDNHLLLIDLTNKNITGWEAEKLLDEVNITLNKNTVPFDKRSPFNPSGIRLGTPAVTTRGMKEEEMVKIGKWISQVINNKSSKEQVVMEIKNFSVKFPIPGI